jgi:hypothetical protein
MPTTLIGMGAVRDAARVRREETAVDMARKEALCAHSWARYVRYLDEGLDFWLPKGSR